MGFAIRHDHPGSEYYCATDYSMQYRLMCHAVLLSDGSNVENLTRCRLNELAGKANRCRVPAGGRPGIDALSALGCTAVLVLAATAGYDAIVRVTLLRDYDRKIQDFQAKAPLLRQAFPLDPALLMDPSLRAGRLSADGFLACSISNVHEAQFMLRRIGWLDSDIPRATAMFLSASVPESYAPKTLRFLSSDEVATSGTKGASFEFYIRDEDAAKRFFGPLPDWYAEALQHNIEVSRVPDWMKPGEPPASLSFTEWLDSRSSWLILAAGMLVLSLFCFVAGSGIDKNHGRYEQQRGRCAK